LSLGFRVLLDFALPKTSIHMEVGNAHRRRTVSSRVDIVAPAYGNDAGTTDPSDPGMIAPRWGREIPSRFILLANVVRCRPRRAAAPFEPPITQPTDSSVRRISVGGELRERWPQGCVRCVQPRTRRRGFRDGHIYELPCIGIHPPIPPSAAFALVSRDAHEQASHRPTNRSPAASGHGSYAEALSPHSEAADSDEERLPSMKAAPAAVSLASGY
jgi:hypothetical protein